MFGEAEYGLTQMALEQGSGGFEQDSKLIVSFQMKPHLDKQKSREEGRPIYTSKEYITIIVPGDKNNIVCQPVWELHRRRFAPQYARFKNNQEQSLTGTPLETVPWITREQVEELKFFNVRTIENLADMADNNAQRFMGIHKLRQRARDHIAAAKEAAPVAKMQEELRSRDAMIAALQKQMTELQSQVERSQEISFGKAAEK